eukprot:151216_1
MDELREKLKDMNDDHSGQYMPGKRRDTTWVSRLQDGLTNVGVGSMEDTSEQGATSAADWYEGIGNLAQLAGVTVSVISISGDENCRLENIGRVADLTAGHVDKIDPLKVAKNFPGKLQSSQCDRCVSGDEGTVPG